MSVDIPPRYVPFVQESIASGRFESEKAMVDEAFKLLEQRERERRLVEEGLDELDRGEYLEFNEEELAQFFDDIKRRGRERLNKDDGTNV